MTSFRAHKRLKRTHLHELLVQRAARMRSEPTRAEAALWAELKHDKRWDTQVPLIFYIADFLHLPTSTIIEVDGLYHQQHEVFLKDQRRTKILSEKGFTIIRFDNDEVLNTIDEVLTRINAIIDFRTENTITKALERKARKDARPPPPPIMHKKWTGRGYIRTKEKPDIMSVVLPKRKH